MRGVRCIPETISQLAMFGTWNCVDSMYHTSVLYLVTSPTSTCAPTAMVGVHLDHTTSYPMQFLQYTSSGILVSLRSITL